MLDVIMKTMIADSINSIFTTMQCTVVSKSPIILKPLERLNYKDGEEEYPLIMNAKALAQWTLTLGDVTPNSDFVTDETTFSGGVPISFPLPLKVGDTVLVAFNKRDLTDAVILGVL